MSIMCMCVCLFAEIFIFIFIEICRQFTGLKQKKIYQNISTDILKNGKMRKETNVSKIPIFSIA